MRDVDYASGKAPPDYRCATCGAHGVKLWREYQTAMSTLYCVACAEQSQGKRLDLRSCDQIGWLVPAVPDEEGAGFWGYTSVPPAGVAWWKALPMAQPATDADIAREFFRRFGPNQVLIGPCDGRFVYVQQGSEVWWSEGPTAADRLVKHAAGEDGFVAALERARELVRKGGG